VPPEESRAAENDSFTEIADHCVRLPSWTIATPASFSCASISDGRTCR
jgi:hypothetical protein